MAVQYHLSASVLEGLEKASAVNTPAAYSSIPGVTAAIVAAAERAVRTAYSKAFQTVYYTSIAFGVIAIFIACFTVDVESKLTNRVAVVLENAKRPNAELEKVVQENKV
jgi:hypothetical protein